MGSARMSSERMGGGSKDGFAFNQQHLLGSGCLQYLVIMTVILLLLPLVICANMCNSSLFVMKVLDRCVGARPKCQQKTSSNNLFQFELGCSVRIMCAYDESTCLSKSNRSVAVFRNFNTDQTVVQSSECNVTLEIQNGTLADKGSYTCADLNDEPTSMCRNEFITFGHCPEKPRNITFMYRPKNSMSLWVDPGKRGFELGDNTTRWRASFKWDEKWKKCSGRKSTKCTDLSPEGCKVCSYTLMGYQEDGVYRLGSIMNRITYNITAVNSIGSVATDDASFIPVHWVKPGPVEAIKVKRTNSSVLHMKIKAPREIDQAHLYSMLRTPNPNLTRLSFNYTVDLLPLTEQYRLQSETEEFYKSHGFYRNEEYDKAALTDQITSDFPRMYQDVFNNDEDSYLEGHYRGEWDLGLGTALPNFISFVSQYGGLDLGCSEQEGERGKDQLEPWHSSNQGTERHIENEKFKITNLPLSAYFYNVSVQTKAYYWGDVVWKSAKTGDNKPAEGPQFESNFAHCPITDGTCLDCLLYFKEIPLPKRGGIILNHTLTLTLLNWDAVPSDSAHMTSKIYTTGGLNNTFHLKNLTFGANYSISLQAWNSVGSSPATSTFLFVPKAPPPFAARDIVLERDITSGGQYYDIDIIWKPGEPDAGTKINYAISTCYALPLSQYECTSGVSDVPLNCVNNLKVKTSEPGINSDSFNQLPQRQGLIPAIFVSSITSDHQKSQLLAPQCFYAKSKGPEKASSLSLRQLGSQEIEVKFQLPCRKKFNYAEYGRPHSYAVKSKQQVDKSTCTQQCSQLMMDGGRLIPTVISSSLQDPVVTRIEGQEAGVHLCVGVALFHADEETDQKRDWSCQPFFLQPEVSNHLTFGLGISITLLFLLLICFVISYRKCRRVKKHFSEIKVPAPPHQIHIVQGKENPQAERDSCFPLIDEEPVSTCDITEQVSTSDTILTDTELDSLPVRSGSGVSFDTSRYLGASVPCDSQDRESNCTDIDADDKVSDDEEDKDGSVCSLADSSQVSRSSSPEIAPSSYDVQESQELLAAGDVPPHGNTSEVFPQAPSANGIHRESEHTGPEEESLKLEDLLQAAQASQISSTELASCRNDSDIEKEDLSLPLLLQASQNSQITKPELAVGGSDDDMEVPDTEVVQQGSQIISDESASIENGAPNPQVLANNHSDLESGFETSSSAEFLTGDDHSSPQLVMNTHSKKPDTGSALERKKTKLTLKNVEADESARTNSTWKSEVPKPGCFDMQHLIKRSHSADNLKHLHKHEKWKDTFSDSVPLLEMNSLHSSPVDSTFSAENRAFLPSEEKSCRMCTLGNCLELDTHYCKVAHECIKESSA